MKKSIKFEDFVALSREEKLIFLGRFSDAIDNPDDDYVYSMGLANRIMDEDYEVLKRLADS